MLDLIQLWFQQLKGESQDDLAIKNQKQLVLVIGITVVVLRNTNEDMDSVNNALHENCLLNNLRKFLFDATPRNCIVLFYNYKRETEGVLQTKAVSQQNSTPETL